MLKIHNSIGSTDTKSTYYRRLAFDEILSNLIALSKNRKRLLKKKKKIKKFNDYYFKEVVKNLPFELTKNQKKIISDINFDLKSDKKMSRIAWPKSKYGIILAIIIFVVINLIYYKDKIINLFN